MSNDNPGIKFFCLTVLPRSFPMESFDARGAKMSNGAASFFLGLVSCGQIDALDLRDNKLNVNLLDFNKVHKDDIPSHLRASLCRDAIKHCLTQYPEVNGKLVDLCSTNLDKYSFMCGIVKELADSYEEDTI